MSRPALTALAAVALLVAGTRGGAGSLDPHLDLSLVPAGCSACHKGHGASRSPMLSDPQRRLCLTCHGSRADLDRAVREGRISAAARPPLLASVLAEPNAHPLSASAFSEHEPGAVACTSCHSPHRGIRDRDPGVASGRRRLSPKDPRRAEYELCETCHGSRGRTTQSLSDISRVLDPSNRSYHPVQAPAREVSPSVLPALSGREINCTDCHGNGDSRGARGPHGSREPFLLRAGYATLDGSGESASTYALCYGCHRREAVLQGSAFPGHKRHVTELKGSCATCHDAHGSVANRALIRFGEDTAISGVAPSAKAGRLAFVSNGPGAGQCFVTCHGFDHGPENYGMGVLKVPLP